MRASSASFGLSLKKSFILIDFIEKPQFHIQMQKKKTNPQKKTFLWKNPCAMLREKLVYNRSEQKSHARQHCVI